MLGCLRFMLLMWQLYGAQLIIDYHSYFIRIYGLWFFNIFFREGKTAVFEAWAFLKRLFSLSCNLAMRLWLSECRLTVVKQTFCAILAGQLRECHLFCAACSTKKYSYAGEGCGCRVRSMGGYSITLPRWPSLGWSCFKTLNYLYNSFYKHLYIM